MCALARRGHELLTVCLKAVWTADQVFRILQSTASWRSSSTPAPEFLKRSVLFFFFSFASASPLVPVSCVPRWGQNLKISLQNEPISLDLIVAQFINLFTYFQGKWAVDTRKYMRLPLLLKWVRPVRKSRAPLCLVWLRARSPSLGYRSSGPSSGRLCGEH